MKRNLIEPIAPAPAAFLFFAAGGCHTTVCDDSARAALTVIVDVGGAPICDATVTAHDGAFSQVLMPLGSAPTCTYSGAYERAGNYTVDVVSGTHRKTVGGIVVTPGECHVNGIGVSVSLDDAADAGSGD